jgi:hypothetical protein
MRVVKVKFNRIDVFNKFFNVEFIYANKEKIEEFGVDFIVLKDDVIGNNEADSRNNTLFYIKSIIDGDDLIENKICEVVIDKETAMANFIFATVENSDKRQICEIISVKEI